MLTLCTPCRQVARDVAGIEVGTRKCTNPVTHRYAAWLKLAAKRSVVEIGAENLFRRRAQIFGQRRLRPAHDLCVGPRSLDRIGAARAFAADDNVAIGAADRVLRCGLEIATERADNKLGYYTDPARNDLRDGRVVVPVVRKFAGARKRAHKCR